MRFSFRRKAKPNQLWAPRVITCTRCGMQWRREHVGWDGPQPGAQGTIRCNECGLQQEIKFEVNNGN